MRSIFAFLVLLFASLNASPQVTDSSKREIKLQGAINFRDLGGYATKDGRHVKWGKIYRSAALDKLTETDQLALQHLKVAIVADFRGPYEVNAAADRLPACAYRISLPAGSENIGDSSYMKTTFNRLQSDSFLVQFYRNITPFKERYAPMFTQLLNLNRDSALVFHCTAGKDRTGIAAALLLYALGVDKETIIGDYVATNYYRAPENARMIANFTKAYGLTESQAKNIMAAKPEYLNATFLSIEEQYGSVDNFLLKEMGLDKDHLKKLKALYLE